MERPFERRNNLGARFVIKVPRSARLDRITSSNGGIHTTDGAGPARLKTSNGAIQVEDLNGSLDAGVPLLDGPDTTAGHVFARFRIWGEF